MLQHADGEFIVRLLSEVWCLFYLARPELARQCGPFGKWLDEDPRSELVSKAAAAIARAAVKAGLLDLTLDPEMAHGVDVLGHVYMQLQSASARKGRGEFYTPSHVSLLLAKMTLHGAEPGQSICEPCAGTGGMLRAAAQALREDGQDPADFAWYANDINPVAVAALAVNAHVWGLGPGVVVSCADALAVPDWAERAVAAQREATAQAGELRRIAYLQALIGVSQGPEGQAGEDSSRARRAG